jgi:hypothetical protein
MGALLIVLSDPVIEIGLKLLDRPIDPAPERDATNSLSAVGSLMLSPD